MFPLLTKYLVQYGYVCIPHIGTFEIVQQPPVLDIADKRVNPPFFKTRFLKEDAVPDQQFSYLASAVGNYNTRRELINFGEQLRESIRRRPLKWNGFGTLRFSLNELVFEPESIFVPSLTEVVAQKVMRENVQHNMLVGDREMSSREITDVLKRPSPPRPLFITIGWIILGLATLAIIALLYLGKFETSSSGLRMHF